MRLIILTIAGLVSLSFTIMQAKAKPSDDGDWNSGIQEVQNRYGVIPLTQSDSAFPLKFGQKIANNALVRICRDPQSSTNISVIRAKYIGQNNNNESFDIRMLYWGCADVQGKNLFILNFDGKNLTGYYAYVDDNWKDRPANVRLTGGYSGKHQMINLKDAADYMVCANDKNISFGHGVDFIVKSKYLDHKIVTMNWNECIKIEKATYIEASFSSVNSTDHTISYQRCSKQGSCANSRTVRRETEERMRARNRR